MQRIVHHRHPGRHIAIDSELLILSFELKFLCADIFPCEDSKILSVCPYPERRNHLSFVNISPTLVIDTSMERSSWVLQHENQKKIDFFFKKGQNFNFFSKNFEIDFWLVLESWNHLNFVNVSPTLVIDTSMERSSRSVSWDAKSYIFFKKIGWATWVFLLSCFVNNF